MDHINNFPFEVGGGLTKFPGKFVQEEVLVEYSTHEVYLAAS
jgi:hypothetical protein